MFRPSISVIAIGALLASAAISSAANAQTEPAAAKIDYSKSANWLCLPGRKDSCAENLTTTVVAADGKLTNENWKANPKAPIDCFYVYPTVSLDATGNSDMNPGPEEHSVARVQFARFGSQCRTFAPMYRQITLTALRDMMSGKPMKADRMLGYNDVLNAWNYYLAHDNKGRGVVLIGHSQGSGVLTQLIKNEIDGKPIQKQLISAILMGTVLPVPKGKDVGGGFQHIPLCHSESQVGCVIAYASFRSTVPPPSNSLFGHVPDKSMMAACVNPAALGGGSGQLHSYFFNNARPGEKLTDWSKGKKVSTPFVSTPGLVSAECVDNDKGSYLQITVHGNPADPRTDEISGDVIANGQVQANWGLHLIDANLAMGNLVDIVHHESHAYLAQKK